MVYIPIGTIEWHGPHNCVGADTIQAEELAILCARRGGGLVFPPLWYGENRLEALMESASGDKEKIAECMDLPPVCFTPERSPFTATEQTLAYQKLLLHILAEADSLGFRVGVLVAGHYPLIDHARSAVLLWNQRQIVQQRGRMLAWAFVDYLLVADRFECAGDHAGGWETSHMLATHPETVDLKCLPAKGQKIVGAGGRMAPQDATAAFGKKTMAAAADVAVKEVRHRLENTAIYLRHGCSLKEGLWKGERAARQ